MTRRGTAPSQLDNARVFDEARTTHLERLTEMTPATFIYRDRRYDFDASLASEVGAVHRSRLSTMFYLLRTPLGRVELNEPALIKAWPSVLLYVTAIRARNLVSSKSRRTHIVVYAIDNSDVVGNLSSFLHVPRVVAAVVCRLVLRYELGPNSRVAFGTDQARIEYGRVDPRIERRVTTSLVPAIAARCPVCAVAPRGDAVSFVGSLEQRKGVDALLAAWPEVRAALPDAELSILGKGELEPEVVDWAKDRGDVSVMIDPSRQSIHEVLRRTKVLVLFSQPEPRWREQIGLPILEALSHGCLVVTSDQTGIAAWLAEHGHVVVPIDRLNAVGRLRDAIVRSVLLERTPQDVLNDLPAEDGRVAADRWLFGA